MELFKRNNLTNILNDLIQRLNYLTTTIACDRLHFDKHRNKVQKNVSIFMPRTSQLKLQVIKTKHSRYLKLSICFQGIIEEVISIKELTLKRYIICNIFLDMLEFYYVVRMLFMLSCTALYVTTTLISGPICFYYRQPLLGTPVYIKYIN